MTRYAMLRQNHKTVKLAVLVSGGLFALCN